MVFSCRCFSFSFGEEIEYETRLQTKSTSVETFYTAPSDLNGSATNSHSAPHTIPDPAKSSDFPCLAGRPRNLRVFTLAELKAATRNFGRSSKIGEGAFGSVYRGVIKSLEYPFDEIRVAVKQGTRGLQGHKQWVAEVNVLGQVQHPNLVNLLGFCSEDDESGIHRLLVYEYMPNGNFHDHLFSESDAPPSWAMRLSVALDTARGLAYLHEGMNYSIIMRDFKPSNILLDDQWNAKISDFGYARLGPLEGHTHVTTRVAGTNGYTAPEYMQTGHLRIESDVWSYGVFLYVLITGRHAWDCSRSESEKILIEWVKPYMTNKKFRLMVDSRIAGHFPLQSARGLAIIANKCLIKDQNLRPKMSVVLDMLHQLKMESLPKTIPPLAPILDLEGATDGQKVSHEQQSSTIMRLKRKRRFVCLCGICSSTN